MRLYRFSKALELAMAGSDEPQALADTQLGDDARHEYLARLRLSAQAGGELDGGAEQILMLLNRLTGTDADANRHRAIRPAEIIFAQIALDLAGTAYRARGRQECGHNAVAGMLDLAPAIVGQRLADDAIVDGEHRHRRIV